MARRTYINTHTCCAHTYLLWRSRSWPRPPTRRLSLYSVPACRFQTLRCPAGNQAVALCPWTPKTACLEKAQEQEKSGDYSIQPRGDFENVQSFNESLMWLEENESSRGVIRSVAHAHHPIGPVLELVHLFESSGLSSRSFLTWQPRKLNLCSLREKDLIIITITNSFVYYRIQCYGKEPSWQKFIHS